MEKTTSAVIAPLLDSSGNYHHERWQNRRRFLRFLMRTVGFTMLARIQRVEGLENIPPTGATLIVINHIAFIDPMAVMHVYPRLIVPMAKREVYDIPVLGGLPKLWGVIPVERESFDRQAVRQAEEVLRAGEVVLIAPEGTRGPALKEGKEGVAFIAARTGATILPVAIDGTIGFPTFPFSPRWFKPGAVIRFGRPCRLRGVPSRPGREDLRRITDDIMTAIARLLPGQRRGFYTNRVNDPLDTLEFL